jgi:hypothetical protein
VKSYVWILGLAFACGLLWAMLASRPAPACAEYPCPPWPCEADWQCKDDGVGPCECSEDGSCVLPDDYVR